MKDGKVYIWMNLLGFNRDDDDRGVERFLSRTGFVPDGVVALVCNVDFFNLHKGMDEEYTLPPDNCAYWGIPRNAERERQPWTNYDLKALTENLKEKGVNTYASVFGNYLDNSFHEEWIKDHPEIFRDGIDGFGAHGVTFVLKRFKDGSYFEDYFVERVATTLTDYGMKGIHLADNMCPAFGGMMSNLDFSTDFVDQFLTHTGITLPDEIMATMGDNSKEAEIKRSEYIYRELRAEWIEFSAWRWEVFFTKLCTRLHAIDKEVIALAMYCTDPFETLYCLGTDLKRIVNAGVDYISANILPSSGYVVGGRDVDPFHKYMAIASTTSAHLPKNKVISMLAVQDPTEEWSMMHHAPTRHERDLYSMMSYHVIDSDGARRALDGYFLCLGDGISASDWDWERDRLERALTAEAADVVSPVMLWSENAHQGMLREYIKTRRWTPHKHFYEISKHGTMCGGTVLPEGLKHHKGAVLVPNIDMLTSEEMQTVLNYNGAVLATASPEFDTSSLNVTFEFSDPFSSYPLKAFVLNGEVSSSLKNEISELLLEDDGTENLTDIINAKEPDYVLHDTLTFSKVTDCFTNALARVLNAISGSPFEIDKPSIVLKLKNGDYRLYLYSDHDFKYRRAFVKSRKEILDAKTLTHFPILPPRWMEISTNKLHHIYKDGEKIIKKNFEIKLPPAGITVIDVTFK